MLYIIMELIVYNICKSYILYINYIYNFPLTKEYNKIQRK